ncbi:MAG TPA: glycosyltransferase family 4 protein [Chitinophagaceae bacterium]|nr:glycosyltransferase family 4 protein [Chitinophagaceae bacterium]
MKLIYATVFDSNDIRNWSGLGVYYGKMLRQAGFDELASISLQYTPFHGKVLNILKTKLDEYRGREVSPVYTLKQSEDYAQIVNRRIGKGTHILSPNTVLLATPRKHIKKILYTDATLDNLLNFYSNYFSLSEQVVSEAQQIEQEALKNSDLLIYTSKWAADAAINNYRADPKKVFIIPFGANINCVPTPTEAKTIIEKRDLRKGVKLLFLGIDWDRKGGDYAVQVAQKLNAMNIPTTLHLAGIPELPPGLDRTNIVDHGFISKSSVRKEMKLCRLIAQSHFLMLPSLADCTPVAFSEANAFGVPCLASRVGGHASIIKDGINGKTFLHADFVDSSVAYISSLVEKEQEYKELCYSSYNEYQEELNWKATGEKIAKLIKSI